MVGISVDAAAGRLAPERAEPLRSDGAAAAVAFRAVCGLPGGQVGLDGARRPLHRSAALGRDSALTGETQGSPPPATPFILPHKVGA